ncbi:MAG: MFS transporter [Dehalococcoidia bacterium]
MIHVRKAAATIRGERARVFELAAVVFLWQAAVGVYFISLVQQYLPEQLGTGAAFPGFAMASYGVAKFLWQTPAGWIADRLGRRVTMIAGMALSLPVLAAMMATPNEVAFLAFSALLGMGAATMWPAFMAHVGETTPRGRRTGTMSVLNIAQMAGIGIGTVVGVVMVDFVTYGAAFWACIGFSLLALVVTARSIETGAVAPYAEVSGESKKRVHVDAAWTPSVFMLAVIVLFLTLGTSLHTPMIGAYTSDVLRVKMSFLALLFPVPAVVAGAAMWKFGRLADRLPRHVPLAAGLFVAAMSIFALTLTRNPYIAVNLVVLAGLAYAITIPAWGAAALDATDVGSRGLWLGALSAVQGLGVATGQGLGGVIGGVWGPLAPFKLAALLLLVALALIVSHQQLQARQRRAAATIPAG